MNNSLNRNQIVIRTGFIGILANLFLAGFKAFVGFASNSIAIVMDALNNISDAAGSLITIIGTKLAGKEADRKHPFGYGRIEYLSALLISLLVLYAGITALTESVKKIINPDVPDYTAVTLIVLVAAIIVKFFLSFYVKGIGKKVNSASLVNSGEDAFMDAIISLSTLIAALIYLRFNISLEAYLGTFISLLIIKSGISMISETVSRILGEPGDPQQALAIKKTVSSFKEVKGVYDLVLQDYGPDFYTASLHIEVEDTMSVDELDKLLRKIMKKVYEETGIALTAIGIYSINTKDERVIKIRKQVSDIVFGHKEVTQLHGFNADPDNKELRFDVVISLDSKNRKQIYADIFNDVQKAYPDYQLNMNMDTDYIEAL